MADKDASRLQLGFPIVVYGLADLPPLLTDGIAPSSALWRACFYAGVAGPTTRRGINAAFKRVPEPECEDTEVGMRIAKLVVDALTKTGVAFVIQAVGSSEEAQKKHMGFHGGDVEAFRAALIAEGLTLEDGARVFREQMAFMQSSTPFLIRTRRGRSLSFRAPHAVTTNDEADAQLFATMRPPIDWQCTLVGRDGGVVEADEPSADAAVPLARSLATLASKMDETSLPADLEHLSPSRLRAALGADDADSPAGEALLRQSVESLVTLGPDRIHRVAREWARYLISQHVTGRMAPLGDAILAAISQLVGQSRVDMIVADENARATGTAQAMLEAWIVAAEAWIADRTGDGSTEYDVATISGELQAPRLEDLVDGLREHGVPLGSRRLVLDAGWAATELAAVCEHFGFERDGELYQHHSGLRVTTSIDVGRARAFLEASGGEPGLAAGFVTCVRPACRFHDAALLVEAARLATGEQDIARLLWQLGAAGPHPESAAFVERWLSRWQDEPGIVGEAAREARALYAE